MGAEARSKGYTTRKVKRVDMRDPQEVGGEGVGVWEKQGIVNKEIKGEVDGHYNEDAIMGKKQDVCRII